MAAMGNEPFAEKFILDMGRQVKKASFVADATKRLRSCGSNSLEVGVIN
jgi:hypothetical protein